MAILNSVWLKGAKKKLAGTVLYQSAGRTIQRELAASVSNPRTEAQMANRVKLANLVSFYRANKNWMKYAYENKLAYQSEYNALVQLNMSQADIFFTKEQARQAACVVSPYRITQGTLPAIEIAAAGSTGWTTNVQVDLADISTATVADFTESLLRLNRGLHEDDQLSIIRLTQTSNNTTGIPYVIVRKYEVLLSLSNTQPLSNYWPMDIVTIFDAEDTWLGILNNGNAGGWAMIHSRTSAGRTHVSSQDIVLANMDAIRASYSSASALAAAIASYGETSDAFLSSMSAGYRQEGDIAYSIMSVSCPELRYTSVANDFFAKVSAIKGKTMVITMNQSLNVTPEKVYVDLYDTSSVGMFTQYSVTGANITISNLAFPDGTDNYNVRKVRVVIDGVDIEIPFANSLRPLD